MTTKVSIPHRRSRRVFPLLAASALLMAQACLPQDSAQDSPAQQTAAALRSDPHLAAAVARSSDHLMQLRSGLGLDSEYSFLPRSAVVDQFGLTHLRYDQSYRGVRVWAGD